MKNNRKNKFSLLALLFFSLLAKVMGALYRIPLTNVLGAEGIGLYQLVFPLYAFCVTLVSGALPTAVASGVAKKENEIDKQVLTVSYALFFTIIAIILFLLLAFFGKYLSYLLGNSRASFALLLLSPSLLFCATSSSIRGYFQGKKNMFPFGISQILEQGSKVIFGLLLASFFLPYGVEYAVGGATLGISIAEFSVALVMFIMFLRKTKRLVKPSFSLLKNELKTVFPLLAGVLVLPLTQVVDSALIVNLLTPRVGEEIATVQYGLLTGPVASLINLPSVLIASVSAWILPSVVEQKGSEKTKKLLSMCAKAVVVGSSVYAVSLFVFAPSIVQFLYSGLSVSQQTECVSLLKISAITVFLVSLLRIITVFLQGVGKFSIPTVDLLFAVAIKTLVTVLAIKPLGIYGCAVATVVGYTVAVVLDFIAIKKEISFEFMGKYAISYGFCFVLYGSIAFSVYSLFPSIMGAIVGFGIGGLVLLGYLQSFRLIDCWFLVKR